MSGDTVSYEGRFDIISLSGFFLLSEDNGRCHRTGGLSVSLAGSDGIVLGGVLNPNASRLVNKCLLLQPYHRSWLHKYFFRRQSLLLSVLVPLIPTWPYS